MNLVRALFPKWDFFDQVGHSLFLEYRCSESDPWKRLVFSAKRFSLGIFFNANMNMNLASIHILEQFAMNPSNESSFKMLRGLLKYQLEEINFRYNKVQFQVVAIQSDETQIIFQSDWMISL